MLARQSAGLPLAVVVIRRRRQLMRPASLRWPTEIERRRFRLRHFGLDLVGIDICWFVEQRRHGDRKRDHEKRRGTVGRQFMSGLGRSRQKHSAPILNNVRFGPLATKMMQRGE